MRHDLFNKITHNNHFFEAYTDERKFIWLMSTEDGEELKNISAFIRDIFTKRREQIDQKP